MSARTSTVVFRRQRHAHGAILAVLVLLLSTVVAQAQTYPGKVGINLEGIGGRGMELVDVARTTRSFEAAAGGSVAKDSAGWPMADARTVLFDMRPVAAWAGSIDDPAQYQIDVTGTYKLSFTGHGTVNVVEGSVTVANQAYNSTTNTTSADLVVNGPLVYISFTNTRRTSSHALNTGFTNLRVTRPGYAHNTTQIFHTPFLSALNSAAFSTIRFMDWTHTNNNNPSHPTRITWSERPTVGNDASWGDNYKRLGAPWEYCVLLANASNKDLWINVPVAANDDYITKLAQLVRYGSDGVNPYTTTQANPVYPPLNSNLNVWVEYSNEIWNWAFWQSTWNNNEAQVNGLTYVTQYAKRTVEISNLFKNVFGASAINSRVRVANCWQIGYDPPELQYNQQMNYINTNYGPPNSFIYALGVAPYFAESPTAGETVATILSQMQSSTDNSASRRAIIKGVADTWNMPGGLVAYEGGPDNGGGSTVNIANRILANRDPGMGTLVERDLRDNWFGIGGNLFMYFTMTSGYNRYGCWGLTDDATNPDRNYKFQAVRNVLGSQGTFGNSGNPWPIASSGTTRIQAENYDVGGEDVAYSDATSGNSGSSYRTDNVDVETTTDTGGGYNVGWIASGEWLEYTVNVAAAGTYDIKLRVARQPTGSGSLSVSFNGADKTGAMSAPSTGAWQTFTTITKTGVSLSAGEQVMRLNLLSDSINVNWIEITAAAGGTGSISREVWTGVSGNDINLIPLGNTPNLTDTLTSFEAPTNWSDSYGTRVRGYLTAPQTGSYTFWIASDDDGELWLSTTGSPANKVRIAYVDGWTSSRQWDKYASQKSAAVSLTAGQKYYVEALHKEGAGGDNLAVGWAKPGQSTTAPSEVIPGAQLSPWDGGGSSGTLLAHDAFAYSAGALHGLNGGSGWGAAWAVQNGDISVPGYNVASTSPLSFSTLDTSGNYAIGGDSYQTSGRTMNLSAGGPFDANGYLSGGLIGASGKTLWMSVLIRKDGSNDQDAWVHQHSENIVTWPQNAPRVGVGYFGTASNTGSTRYWSLRLGSTVTKSNVPVTLGQTALLVVKVTFGATTTADLYVNPSGLGGSAPGTVNAGASTTSSMAFKHLGYYGGSGTNQSAIDEIRFGTTYGSVTP